jgi:hypothetical protein
VHLPKEEKTDLRRVQVQMQRTVESAMDDEKDIGFQIICD